MVKCIICVLCGGGGGGSGGSGKGSLGYGRNGTVTAEIFGGVIFSVFSEIGGSVEGNFGKPFFQVGVLVLVPTFSVHFILGKYCQHRTY